MIPEVWDYIFLEKPYPPSCGIPEEKLKAMRKEFDYWCVRAAFPTIIPLYLSVHVRVRVRVHFLCTALSGTQVPVRPARVGQGLDPESPDLRPLHPHRYFP
jgi:hypothetical protein